MSALVYDVPCVYEHNGRWWVKLSTVTYGPFLTYALAQVKANSLL